MSEQENRAYELIYVIQPDLDDASLEALQERISQTITNQSGEITKTEAWGKRKLAYPIGNFYEGHYTVHHLQMPPEGVEAIEQVLRYSEDVIRFLTMYADEAITSAAPAAAPAATPEPAE